MQLQGKQLPTQHVLHTPSSAGGHKQTLQDQHRYDFHQYNEHSLLTGTREQLQRTKKSHSSGSRCDAYAVMQEQFE